MEDEPNEFVSGGLFAAALATEQSEAKSNVDQLNWLNNQSFKKNVNDVNRFEEQAASDKKHRNTEDKEHKKRKHKKEKKKKSKKSRTKSPEPQYRNDQRSSKRLDSKPVKHEDAIRTSKYEKESNIKSSDKTESILFKIDRKYEKDNLLYDGLYAGDIPKYKTNESRSLKHRPAKPQRYFKVRLGECVQLKSQPIVNKLSNQLIDLTINQSYIELINTNLSKPDDQPVRLKSTSSETLPTETKNLDEEIHYENQLLYTRIKEFNSQLNLNPNDVDLWIEFIRFQDELKFEMSSGDLREKSIINDVHLAEKKLLILEKALKSNPKNLKLLILKLELLKDTTEPAKLNEEWKNLAFVYPTNFEITKNYIKFITTHLSYFNISNLNKFFSKYMEKIVQYQDTGNLRLVREFENSSIERSILEVLLIYTIILRQCGFIEKSISIWQALIDFNFNRPDFLNNADTKLDDLKEYFEIFWSSGKSRFGEQDAQGWKSAVDKTKSNSNELKNENELIDKLVNDKENEAVLNYKNNNNRIWFEIELIRERYGWLSAKLHEDCDDVDHTVLFEDISDCLFRFKDESSYQYCLLYFLFFLNAINNLDELDLPVFLFDNEKQFLNYKNSNLFAPKYFTYDQRLKFIIIVFQQSISLMENRNLEHYHQLVDRYFNFIIENVNQLDKNKSRKLFKQMLKKPLNCNKITFWRKYVELEMELNEQASARSIYDKILEMLINQQSNDHLNENLSIIHDFIEFNLRVQNVKSNSLDMINCLKIDDASKEKEIGEQILKFIYSLLNSRKISDLKEINAVLQLRTKQRIEKLFNDCLGQVVDKVVHNETYKSEIINEDNNQLNNSSNQQVINNLIYLIVLQIYNCYFNRLLNPSSDTSSDRSTNRSSDRSSDRSANRSSDKSSDKSSDTPISMRNKTTKLIEDQLARLEKSINSKSVNSYLAENLLIKHLDLHLLYLKFNFDSLTSFNRLLYQAVEQFPKNNYFLTLLVNTESFRFVNGQMEKFTIRLCRKVHETNLEQWLFVIYFEMKRLSNIQQQSDDSFGFSSSLNEDVKSMAIDHTGTYSTGLAIKIRNLFEKALQANNCLLLWRLFIHFEVNQKNLEYAKTIFYRAVQQCPWSKILYMDGVKLFTMSTTQSPNTKSANNSLIQNVHNLNDVLDLMIEKQLRVRTAVEEIELLVDNQASLS